MKILLSAFLVFLIAGFAYAASQQAQQKSSDHSKSTAADKRGTEENPFIIKVLPSPEAKSAADYDREEKAAKRKTDEDLAKFTGQLAAYTSELATYTKILVGVGCIQILVFIAQLVAFISQARQLKRSVDLARDEFNSTHCPRLIIRRINIWQDRASNSQLVINYEIANIGGTRAKIIEISTMLWLPDTSNPLPPIPPYAGGDKSSEIIVESGAPYRGQHYVVLAQEIEKYDRRSAFGEEVTREHLAPSETYFFGYVVYLDQLNRRFETAFLRLYDYRTKRFSPVNDPDYEYLA